MKTKRFLIALIIGAFAMIGNIQNRIYSQQDSITEFIPEILTERDVLENYTASDIINMSNDNSNIKDSIISKLDLLIPLTGIVIPFLFAFLIIVFYFSNKKEREKSRNEVLVKAMEHGQKLPDDFFKKEEKYDLSLKTLKQGLTVSGVGLGFVAWGIYDDEDILFIGLIVLLVGIAKLLFLFFGRKYFKNDKQYSDNNQKEITDTPQ